MSDDKDVWWSKVVDRSVLRWLEDHPRASLDLRSQAETALRKAGAVGFIHSEWTETMEGDLRVTFKGRRAE